MYNRSHKLYFLIHFIFLAFWAKAQSAFVPLNPDYYHIIERYELVNGEANPKIFNIWKPFHRHQVAHFAETIDSLDFDKSPSDEFNIQYLKNDNWEWLQDDGDTFSKKKLWGVFFERKADVYSKKTDEFDIHVSPVAKFTVGNGNNSFWQNTRGIEVRASLSKKLSIYSQFTENQAVLPQYLSDFHRKNRVVPGQGHWKPFGSNGFDYLAARAYVTFNPIKPINLTFGHDKLHVGAGQRSMIYSDFAPPTLFLRIQTQIGKFQYTNQFSQLTNRQEPIGFNEIIPNKYMVSHQLAFKVGKKTELGLVESVVLKRKDQIDFNYLNPVIFYRFVESFLGSPDNAMASLNIRHITKYKTSVYGQFVLDEFVLKDLTKNPNRFTNKWAYQIGAKTVNFLGVKNLDLQAEFNKIRPYTYSHFTTYTNYAHYNQSLAHPMGANLKEWLGVIRYQPYPRTTIYGTFSKIYFGDDRPDQNWGGNILLDYDTRVRDEGNYIGQGRTTDLRFNEIRISQQLIHNLFLDLVFIKRTQKNELTTESKRYQSLSLRWNIPYQQFVQ